MDPSLPSTPLACIMHNLRVVIRTDGTTRRLYWKENRCVRTSYIMDKGVELLHRYCSLR